MDWLFWRRRTSVGQQQSSTSDDDESDVKLEKLTDDELCQILQFLNDSDLFLRVSLLSWRFYMLLRNDLLWMNRMMTINKHSASSLMKVAREGACRRLILHDTTNAQEVAALIGLGDQLRELKICNHQLKNFDFAKPLITNVLRSKTMYPFSIRDQNYRIPIPNCVSRMCVFYAQPVPKVVMSELKLQNLNSLTVRCYFLTEEMIETILNNHRLTKFEFEYCFERMVVALISKCKYASDLRYLYTERCPTERIVSNQAIPNEDIAPGLQLETLFYTFCFQLELESILASCHTTLRTVSAISVAIGDYNNNARLLADKTLQNLVSFSCEGVVEQKFLLRVLLKTGSNLDTVALSVKTSNQTEETLSLPETRYERSLKKISVNFEGPLFAHIMSRASEQLYRLRFSFKISVNNLPLFLPIKKIKELTVGHDLFASMMSGLANDAISELILFEDKPNTIVNFNQLERFLPNLNVFTMVNHTLENDQPDNRLSLLFQHDLTKMKKLVLSNISVRGNSEWSAPSNLFNLEDLVLNIRNLPFGPKSLHRIFLTSIHLTSLVVHIRICDLKELIESVSARLPLLRSLSIKLAPVQKEVMPFLKCKLFPEYLNYIALHFDYATTDLNDIVTALLAASFYNSDYVVFNYNDSIQQATPIDHIPHLANLMAISIDRIEELVSINKVRTELKKVLTESCHSHLDFTPPFRHLLRMIGYQEPTN